jgi:hypothetical protein
MRRLNPANSSGISPGGTLMEKVVRFHMDQAITAVPTQIPVVPDPSIILFGGQVIQLLMTATLDR